MTDLVPALAANLLAAACLYLGSPNRRAPARVPGGRPLSVAGLALLALAVLLWSGPFAAATAVFTALSVLMAACGVLPWLALMRRPPQGGRR